MGIGVDLFYAANFSPTARYLRDPLLAFNARVEAKPVFDDPALMLYVNCDESGVWTYKGDQGFGQEKFLTPDPNALFVNTATGPSYYFEGQDGRLCQALHDLTGIEDFSTWTKVGTGSGGFERVTGASGAGNYIMRRVTMPIASGTVVKWEIEAHDVSPGDTVQLEINTDTGGATLLLKTITNNGEPLSIQHTLTAAATRVDFRIGQGTGTKAAWSPKNSWGRIVSGPSGRFPMQNLGGFTNVTRPRRVGPWWGMGMEFRNGKPFRPTRGDVYTNGVKMEAEGGDSSLYTGPYVHSGVTSTLVTRYLDEKGRLVSVYDLVGTATTTSVEFGIANDKVRLPAVQNDTLYAALDFKILAGAAPSGGFSSGIHEESAVPGYLIGSGFLATENVGDGWLRASGTRTLTHLSTATGRINCAAKTVNGEAVNVRVAIRQGMIVKADHRVAYMPALPGGQVTSAAISYALDLDEFFPLGPDRYATLGQSGAINNSAALAVGPNLVVNGDGSSGVTGWTGTSGGVVSNPGSSIRVTENDGDSAVGRADQDVTVEAGKHYLLSVNRLAGSHSSARAIASETTNYGTNLGETKQQDGVSSVVVRAADTSFKVLLLAGSTTIGQYGEYDDISLKEYAGVWMSSTGEGRFSVAGDVLTLLTGAAPENAKLLAAPLGWADGDVIRSEWEVTCTAGTIEVRNPVGSVLHTIRAGETRSLKKIQTKIAGGEVIRLYAPADGAGTIRRTMTREVEQGPLTIAADLTVRKADTGGLYPVIARIVDAAAASNERVSMMLGPTKRLFFDYVRGGAYQGGSNNEPNFVEDGTRYKFVGSLKTNSIRSTANSTHSTPDTNTGDIGPSGHTQLVVIPSADWVDLHSLAIFRGADVKSDAEHLEINA